MNASNGTVDAHQAASLVKEVQLSPGALRRLARHQARVEGASAVFALAQQGFQLQQQALREALAEVLEEQGVDTARLAEAQLNIDWRTGVLSLPEAV